MSKKIGTPKISESKDLKDSAIEFYNDIFTFAEKKFNYVILNNVPYFRGKDIGLFLGYKDTDSVIRDNVDEDDKIKLKDILESEEVQKMLTCSNNIKNENSIPGKNPGQNFIPGKNPGMNIQYLKKLKTNTIFLNKTGLTDIIWGSRKEEAIKLKKFISKDLLPTLFKTGHFDMNLDLDTSYVKISFYELNNKSDFKDCNVIYLIAVGKYNGKILLKFGKSGRVIDREEIEHQNIFGEQIIMLHIWKTDNKDKVENLIKDKIKSKGLDTKVMFDGKVREELILLDDMHDIEDIKDLMEEIIEKNPLPLLQEKDNEIQEKDNALQEKDNAIQEKDNTLQEKDRLLQEKDNQIKSLEIKYNIEIGIEKEKTKQIESENQTKIEIEKEKTTQTKEITKQKEIEKEITLSQEKTKQMDLEYKLKLLDKGNVKEEPKKEDNDKNKKYTDKEIKKILKPYFEYTGVREDVILNKKLNEIGFYTNIEKNKVIKYVRTIGGYKYKCGAIQGSRGVKLIKDINQIIHKNCGYKFNFDL
jgi:prophage antirepressor-like protein